MSSESSTQHTFGVHSEVGQLRKVMVCAPGRAHQRLTPSNCAPSCLTTSSGRQRPARSFDS